MKQLTQWDASIRMQNYLHRNKKMSPIHKLNYLFLKSLYMYLTKQEMASEFKDSLYRSYIKLINLSYFPNRTDPCSDTHKLMRNYQKQILENQYFGPVTFIILNDTEHYKKMQSAIDMIYDWTTNPIYHGYASEIEFWEAMNYLRTEFNKDKVDLHDAVGKWPRKFRKRFGRNLGRK